MRYRNCNLEVRCDIKVRYRICYRTIRAEKHSFLSMVMSWFWPGPGVVVPVVQQQPQSQTMWPSGESLQCALPLRAAARTAWHYHAVPFSGRKALPLPLLIAPPGGSRHRPESAATSLVCGARGRVGRVAGRQARQAEQSTLLAVYCPISLRCRGRRGGAAALQCTAHGDEAHPRGLSLAPRGAAMPCSTAHAGEARPGDADGAPAVDSRPGGCP